MNATAQREPLQVVTFAADDQLRRLAKRAPSVSITRRSLWLWRFLGDRVQGRMQGHESTLVNRRDETIGDSIPLRIYQPSTSRGSETTVPTLMWIHGGGFMMGSHLEDKTASRFVEDLGIAVVSVGYRLAPDHPFPAAIDDVWAALEWLEAAEPAQGLDSRRVVVGGASAGGGLAAALAQRAVDQDVEICGQLLLYPMLDDRTVARTDSTRKRKGWTNKSNRVGWSSYLGAQPGATSTPPYAVPARRGDLTGLPAAWIGVGSNDLFADEARRYGERLHASGVGCDFVVVDGGIHGFDQLSTNSRTVDSFNATQIAFLRRVFALTPTNNTE